MSPLGTKRALAQSDVAEAVPIKPAWTAPCQSADGMHALGTGPSGPLAPVPPTGRIFLDQVSENEWVLTDVLTHQSQRVPGGGPWTLVQAGDCGELAIVQDDSASDQDPEVHLVEDLLAVSVHQDSNDVVFFSGGQFGKLQRMEKVLCMRKVGEAKIRLSDGMAMPEVGVMVVRWHRALGVRVFWAAFDIYRALGLTCHSKQPSKWFWNCAPAWERWLAEHFTGRQCILSKHGGYSSPDSAPVPFSERLFEQPAMSTLAFVVQLARWAWCPPQRGGLRDKMAIAAAKQALRALLKLACERSAGRICTFSVDDGWRCMWPRPSHVHDGPATFQASYDDGGMMDFGELCDLSDCSAAPRLTVLWKSRLFCIPTVRSACAPPGDRSRHEARIRVRRPRLLRMSVVLEPIAPDRIGARGCLPGQALVGWVGGALPRELGRCRRQRHEPTTLRVCVRDGGRELLSQLHRDRDRQSIAMWWVADERGDQLSQWQAFGLLPPCLLAHQLRLCLCVLGCGGPNLEICKPGPLKLS